MADVAWVELGFLPVSVGYSPNPKARKAALKHLGIEYTPLDPSDARCEWWSRKGQNDIIIISVSNACRNYSAAQVAGMIAHECMHAFRYIKEITGEQEPSAEFEAYVMQALVQTCFHAHCQSKKRPYRAEHRSCGDGRKRQDRSSGG